MVFSTFFGQAGSPEVHRKPENRAGSPNPGGGLAISLIPPIGALVLGSFPGQRCLCLFRRMRGLNPCDGLPHGPVAFALQIASLVTVDSIVDQSSDALTCLTSVSPTRLA